MLYDNDEIDKEEEECSGRGRKGGDGGEGVLLCYLR